MRNISFSLTTEQFLNGSKDVTRRLWKKAWVKPGDHMMAVEKCQGLKKGEKIRRLGEIEIVSIEPEKLDTICLSSYRVDSPDWPKTIRKDTYREGFPKMSPQEFVDFFCKANRCKPNDIVYRIVFRRVP